MRQGIRGALLSGLGLLALACAMPLAAPSIGRAAAAPAATTDESPVRGPRGQISQVKAAPELRWRLPPNVPARYGTVDGERMKRYVDELVAISLKMKATGEPYWGRIAGDQSGKETQAWIANKFKAAGLQVKENEYELPVQPIPRSWDVAVTANGRTIKVGSASPIINFDEFMPGEQGELTLDTVWVGLGTEADFVGKDVKGKAVFIYSEPTPSSLVQTAAWMRSVERAQKAGASAIIFILAVPGNMHFVSHLTSAPLARNIKVPIFSAGLADGDGVEALYAAAHGQGVSTHVQWKVEMVRGRRAAVVVGMLPGMTDESIVMLAHTDGYFEGANDNAAGTAALAETAAYYAKLPKSMRRRTMYFVATPDHHAGDVGARWMHENMQPIFKKTAVIVNAEHIAVFEPVWDRRWGSQDAPSLMPTNQLGSSWWGVYGSDRMATIIRDDFALFGVPTQINEGGSQGELRQVQWDAPSFYLHNKGVYYHADGDVAAVVPATGLRTGVQAFIKIFDDINKLSLKELQPPPGSVAH